MTGFSCQISLWRLDCSFFHYYYGDQEKVNYYHWWFSFHQGHETFTPTMELLVKKTTVMEDYISFQTIFSETFPFMLGVQLQKRELYTARVILLVVVTGAFFVHWLAGGCEGCFLCTLVGWWLWWVLSLYTGLLVIVMGAFFVHWLWWLWRVLSLCTGLLVVVKGAFFVHWFAVPSLPCSFAVHLGARSWSCAEEVVHTICSFSLSPDTCSWAQCTCKKQDVAVAIGSVHLYKERCHWGQCFFHCTCTKQSVTVAIGTIHLYKARCHCGQWYHLLVQSNVSLWPLVPFTCTKQGVTVAIGWMHLYKARCPHGHVSKTMHRD